MNKAFISLLRCPKTGKKLVLDQPVEENDAIKEGILKEPFSGNEYFIRNFIPRFVDSEDYSANFGLEWNIHDKTQYDEESGYSISGKRFYDETKWDRLLKGQFILEAGSGSGRFTKHAADTGATVVSFDLSNAVEANYKSNGGKKNVLIIQSDIYEMPFEEKFFDKIFCFGVLQHTPDPKKAFLTLVKYLKPGGEIVADIYLKNFITNFISPKYFVRMFTKNMRAERLYKLIQKYIDFMWPVAGLIRRIPQIGKSLNWLLLIADHSKTLPDAPDYILKKWAYLDTFDMLSPKYDFPQTLKTFARWYSDAGLVDINVHYGYNGIEGRGRKKASNMKSFDFMKAG